MFTPSPHNLVILPEHNASIYYINDNTDHSKTKTKMTSLKFCGKMISSFLKTYNDQLSKIAQCV